MVFKKEELAIERLKADTLQKKMEFDIEQSRMEFQLRMKELDIKMLQLKPSSEQQINSNNIINFNHVIIIMNFEI